MNDYLAASDGKERDDHASDAIIIVQLYIRLTIGSLEWAGEHLQNGLFLPSFVACFPPDFGAWELLSQHLVDGLDVQKGRSKVTADPVISTPYTDRSAWSGYDGSTRACMISSNIRGNLRRIPAGRAVHVDQPGRRTAVTAVG